MAQAKRNPTRLDNMCVTLAVGENGGKRGHAIISRVTGANGIWMRCPTSDRTVQNWLELFFFVFFSFF